MSRTWVFLEEVVERGPRASVLRAVGFGGVARVVLVRVVAPALEALVVRLRVEAARLVVTVARKPSVTGALWDHGINLVIVFVIKNNSLAVCDVVRQDGDVLPGSRVPVGVVVSLLRTFITSSVSVRVLSRVDGRTVAKTLVVIQDLVGREQTCVRVRVCYDMIGQESRS